MEPGKLGVITAFPTFACQYLWPDVEDFNRELITELYNARSRDPEGIYRSNMAGCWHSQDRVLTESGEVGKKLGQMFFQLFSALGDCHGGQKGGKYEMNLSAWAMMYRDGGYSSVHTHPNCHFSSVYYAHTGDVDEPAKVMATGVRVKPGSLEFVDTRGGPGTMKVDGISLCPSLRIPPRPGLMIVFPAWLPHFVHPVGMGGHERIAVACNAVVRKYHQPPPDTPAPKEEVKDDPDLVTATPEPVQP